MVLDNLFPNSSVANGSLFEAGGRIFLYIILFTMFNMYISTDRMTSSSLIEQGLISRRLIVSMNVATCHKIVVVMLSVLLKLVACAKEKKLLSS